MMATGFSDLVDLNSGMIAETNAASSSVPAAAQIRACTNCVRAKAKCSSAEVGSKCERCERMKKDCQPSPPVRTRRTGKKVSASRTSKLEQKLDGLVHLLESATKPAAVAARPIDSISVNATSTDVFLPSLGNASGINGPDYNHGNPLANTRVMQHSIPTPASLSESTSLNLQPALQSNQEPCMQDAELYLDKFRTNFARHLPFVIIPPSMTAQQLRQERPILWLCIMAVASSQSTQQINLSRELRTTFGHEAFVEARQSMDLLLAVLVYATWDRRFCAEKMIMTSLVQLAISIVYDLGLHKPPSKSLVVIPGDDKPGHRTSSARTMEERRALLGCFLISSVTCYFQKSDGLRWTAYSAECLRLIEETRELESDILLVQIVKSRLVFEKVMLAPWHDAIPDADHLIRPPTMFYLSALERLLQDFKSNIPLELQDNGKLGLNPIGTSKEFSVLRAMIKINGLLIHQVTETLLLEVCNLEASIYEIGCSHEPDVFIVQSNRRVECLYGCLNAMKRCTDVFGRFTPAQYIGLPFLIYAALSRCVTVFYRILTFEHPEWDPALVRETLDFSLILDEVEAKFSRVKDEAGLDCGGSDDTDPFTLFATRLRKIKMWWDITVGNATVLGDVTSFDGMGDFSMENVDEDWFRDLFGIWNQ